MNCRRRHGVSLNLIYEAVLSVAIEQNSSTFARSFVFSRREIRNANSMERYQLKVHCMRLARNGIFDCMAGSAFGMLCIRAESG